MRRLIFSILFYLFSLNGIFGQNTTCPNLDFETGSLVNWTGSVGSCCPINLFGTGFVSNRHMITSGAGFDPHSLNQIPVVAPGGGRHSVRLGNDNSGSQAEMMSYTVSVTPQSDLFIYRYAVVLEDPSHLPIEQPRFEIRLYDQAGQDIQCGIYNVVASANIPGFQNNFDIRFKTWTAVGIDLSGYHGQNVIVEFRTGDCELGAHFGYAYLDCSCGPLRLQNAFCPNSTSATLTAPEGFASYVWSSGETTSSITVPTSNIGMIYSCTITSVTGCSVTLSTTIASTSINADFSVINNCQNSFLLSDLSTAFNGYPAYWYWDFGDSTVSTTQNPIHIYQRPGTYTIQLITESDMGCKDTTTSQAQIWPAPHAFAATQDVCEGTPSLFSDSSTIDWGNISSVQWNLSDGTSINQSSPNHLFAGPGSYSANFIATSDLGCHDTVSVNFIVNPVPLIEAGRDTTFCGGGTLIIGDSNNPALNYKWSPVFGIANTNSPITNVNIPYPSQSSDLYYYHLTGLNILTGCKSADSIMIEARGIPTASFQTPPVQCFKGNNFNLFADQTYSGSLYHWNFGSYAQPSTLTNQFANSIRYSQPGEFPLTLVVDKNGCIDSATGTLRVVEEPVIQFSVDEEGCPPLTVNFECNVTPVRTFDYLWSFSDNTTSTDEKPVHTFMTPGTYSVSLKVIDPYGCSDFESLVDVIHILPRPDAGFATDHNVASITDPHFSFLNTSQFGDVLQWDFGDNTYSFDLNTTHTYNDTGLFLVKLIIQNSFGCNDTSISNVRVEPYYSFYVPNAFSPNGDGVNDSFRGLGMYIRDYKMWIYNRSGKMIYYTTDYNRPWDGKGDLDNIAQNEVYEYIIRITDTNDESHEYMGHVSLVH